ncbi:trafficking protein particle complex subunit 13-like [Pipistrellus kuhlii]|uniref:trafficking protein particle complex subunit 13-like n=1 Tax=Pipistrellus kuhlii TaxID=59472 RepID=UPI00174F3A49|nr:trafficking protein particle complex subunit 13-like [Pipistrellus kuhlii]
MVTLVELATNCCIDDVIHDKINIGRDESVSSVSIQQCVGKMFLRKLCIFSLFSPLEVKTKFHNSEMSDLFLEILIKNTSSSDVFIQKVFLQPPEMYTATELNNVIWAGEDECTFGTKTFLKSMEQRQYLYRFQIKQEFSEKFGAIKRLTEMGKLDILWKRNLGEMAMIHTVKLEREFSGYRNISISLETIPDTVFLEEPFHITCKITNQSDKNMILVLKMCDTDSIRWCGNSRRFLGKLPPNSSLCFTLTLLILKMGLQSISRLKITDKLLKKTYVCDDVAKVCVIPSIVKMKK